MVEQTPTDKTVICDTPNATPTEGDTAAMPLTSAAASEETAPVSAAPGSETDVAKALNEIAPAAGTPAEPATTEPSPEVCAVPQGEEQASAEMLAGAVTVQKPNANETVNYTIASGQNYNLAFNTKDALVESQGENLVIRFADGAVIILEQFETASTANTKVIVDGCQVVSGADYATMAGLANGLNDIAPAAGGQQAAGPQGNTAPGNSGAGFGQFDGGSLPGGPNPLGPLGATALTYRLIDGLTPEGGPTRLDGKPTISLETPLNVVDETGGGGSGGDFNTPRTNTGTFNYDLGPDGAGSVKITVGPVGLTHHGEPVLVTVSVDGFTATGTTPNGDVIFIFTIDPTTSTYVFTQFGSLDHPDPTDPNEALDLPFVIRVTDADGDFVEGAAVIRVLDDAPAILPANGTVDETDGGTLAASGTVNFSYGGDGAGSVKLVGGPATGLSSGGNAITVTVTDTVVTGTAAGVTVFTLTLNPATGGWDYKQYAPLDHGDPTNPDDAVTLGFTVRVTDYDSDTVDTAINVTVLDDGPEAFSSVNTVDETGGFDTVTGTLLFSFGQDGAGSVKLSSVPTGLTSGGQPVTVTLSADGLTATGTAGGATVFTLTVNPATGAYSFTQTGALDHPDGTDANDSINLGFGYTVTDKDGDTVSSNLNIEVLDDGPSVEVSAVTVDETGGFDSASGSYGVNFGADGKGSAGLVSGPSGLTSHGLAVTNTVSADGLTITGSTAGTKVVYTLTLDPSTGTYVFKQFAPLDHPNAADHNDALNLGFGFVATDKDGDTANATINVTVLDDGPVAGNVELHDMRAGDPPVTGNLPYDFGTDGAGQVKLTSAGTGPLGLTGLTSGGQVVTVTVTATGAVGKLPDGSVAFELTVSGNGVYSYTQNVKLDGNPTFEFGYTVSDFDGDKAKGTITIDTFNGVPTACDTTNVVDETGGFDTVTGPLLYDFGPDGAGSVKFTSGPTGLTAHGVPVNVTFSADGKTVTGMAGDKVVFTLTVGADGKYTFTQLGALDHPNAADHNDSLNLGFSFKVTDADGDTASANLSIKVYDDGPTAGTTNASVDETGGFDSVSGTISYNYGYDGAGSVKLTSAPTTLMTADGQPVRVTISADGLTITGTTETTTDSLVFTLTLNPATGAYTFTQLSPLAHANGSNPNDALDLGFGFQVTDHDGDTANGLICVTVYDDGPTATSSSVKVDETGGFDSVSGNLSFGYGQDGAGSVKLTSVPTGLTSLGQPVNVVVSSDGLTATGTAAGVVIFTLSVNPATGAYTFTQSAQLDHPDAANPNDVLNLGFGYTVTDKDGDTASSQIKVAVYDDAPKAHDDVNEVGPGTNVATGNVVTGLNGGPGAADELSMDKTNKVVQVSYNGKIVNVPANGEATIEGENGTLKISADGSYTYTLKDGAGNAGTTSTMAPIVLTDPSTGAKIEVTAVQTANGVEFTIKTLAGDVDLNKFSLDLGGNGSVDFSQIIGTQTRTDANVGSTKFVVVGTDLEDVANAIITVKATAEGMCGCESFTLCAKAVVTTVECGCDPTSDQFTYVLQDGDGDKSTATLTISSDDCLPTAGDTVAVVDETGGFDTVTGALLYSYGEDGAGSVKFTAGPSGLTSHGAAVVSTVSADGLTVTGKAGDKTVFTATLNPATGTYTFKQIAALDHPNASNPDDAINLGFKFKVTDADGDTATGNLTVTVKDDGPSAGSSTVVVDETGGFDTISGTVSFKYGQDGAGSIELTSAPVGLTSGGQPVSVVYLANSVTTVALGKLPDGTTVFTLSLNTQTGAYTFTQGAALDHPDASNHNDILNLGFGFKVTDADGDKANGTLCVTVYDDGPTAGSVTLENVRAGTPEVSGTLPYNFGADGAGKVLLTSAGTGPLGLIGLTSGGQAVKVTFTGTHAVGKLENGTVVFELKIDAAGKYTYKQNLSLDGSPTFEFGYTVSDADSDKAKGTITIDTANGVPTACDTSNKVDETGGFDTVSGTVPFSFGPDGAGTVKFTAGPTGLTSHGTAVVSTVSADGLTVTGKAGGVTVFTVTLNPATGAYTFKQLAALDHPNAANPDDVLNLGFGFKVTDADGDSANAKLTIAVHDDGPSAGLTNAEVDETGGFDTISGTLAFSFGQDGSGAVQLTIAPTGLTSHGVAVTNTIDPNGLSITGKAGGVTVYTLTLNPATGAYTFKQLAALDHPDGSNPNDVLSLGFGFKVTDYDLDTANGVLCVNVKDDGPSLTGAKSVLDETNANDAVGSKTDGIWANATTGSPLVATGKVAFSFGADGSGAVQLTNAPSGLKHHGEAVTVTMVGNSATGTLANGTLVFTLVLNASTGEYTYKQYASLDHANKADHNDVLAFNFGIKVTDYDGDSVAGKIEFCVNDDGPCATLSTLKVDQSCLQDDCNPNTPLFTATSALDFGYGNDGKGKVALSGVPTGLYSNGQIVTSVLVGSLITGKTASGQTVYTLELDAATGKYTYKQYAEIDTQGTTTTTLNIGYKVTDGDGDTADSKIKIEVSGDLCDPKQPPVICVSVEQCVSTSSETVTFKHEFSETRTWQSTKEFEPISKVLIGMNSDNLTIGGNYTVPTNLAGGTPQHMVSIVFEGETAGFSNSLGWFTVGPNGEMNFTKVAVVNSDAFAKGGKVDLGYVPAGTEVEFFIIPNGAQLNDFASLPTGGKYEFWSNGAPGTAGAHLSTTADAASSIKLFYVAGGTAIEIKTAQEGIFFATHENLNNDGMDHIASGIDAAHPGEIWMGFEDKAKGTSDLDYNDLMFRVQVGTACGTVVTTCSDINLTACISDPDSTLLSAAAIKLTVGVLGDKLDLGGDYTLSGTNVLKAGVDTGVDFVQTSDGGFTLSGNASLSTYQSIISSAELHNSNGTLVGDRTMSFQVTDETGLTSNVSKVSVNYADNTYGDDCLACGVGDSLPVTEPGCILTVGPDVPGYQPLSLSAVLEGHTGTVEDLASYVKVESDGLGNTIVKVDATGSGEHFESMAVMQGVTGVTLDSMVSDGSLDVGRFLNG